MREVKPLIGAIKPFHDESFGSILARSGVTNSFIDLTEIVRLTNVTTHIPEFIPFTHSESAPEFARLLSLPEKDILLRMHPTIAREGLSDSVDWYGTPLPRKFIEAKYRRFSPRSLKEASYGRALWMIRPLTFCPTSLENLSDKCVNGHRLRWRRSLGVHRCDTCGASLRRRMCPGKVDWALRRDAVSAAELVNPRPEVRARALAKLPPPFAKWEPGDVFVAAVELGMVQALADGNGDALMQRRIGAGDFSQFSTNDMVRGYRALLSWPASLYTLVRQSLRDDTRHLEEMFGPLSKAFKEGVAQRPITLLIREEILNLLPDLNLPFLRFKKLQPHWIRHADLLSLHHAMARFRIDADTIKRLDDCGGCIVRTGADGSKVRYNTEQLGQAVEALRSSYSSGEAACKLGLPQFCIGGLEDIGLLERTSSHDAELMGKGPRFTIASVNALIDRAGALPHLKVGSGVTVAKEMRGRFHPREWANAIGALVGGRVKVVIPANGQLKFDSMLVDEGSLKCYCGDESFSPIHDDIEVPALVAGKLIGVSPIYLGKAVKAGALRGRRVGNSLLVNLKDLADFDTRYLLSAEGTRRLGLNSGQFFKRVKASGITPALSLDGIYIWSRKEVEALIAA